MTGSNNIEIRVGGVGGQGISLAGSLLGKAASIYEDREAVFTQTYGPEARGGASRADIIISDTPIAYPFVTRPDMLIVLFQEAYEKFRPDLESDGLLLVEANLVKPRADDALAISVPAIETAANLGNKLAANIVLLGYLVGATDVVSSKAMEEAICATVNKRHLELDMEAYHAGLELAAGSSDD